MRKSNLFGDCYLRIFLYKKGGNDGKKQDGRSAFKKIIFENGITNDHINGFTSSL